MKTGCPYAKITCYNDIHKVNCNHVKNLPTKENNSKSGLLSCKINPKKATKMCRGNKYWICNLNKFL